MSSKDFDDFDDLDFDNMLSSMDNDLDGANQKGRPLSQFGKGFISGLKENVKDTATNSSLVKDTLKESGLKGYMSMFDLLHKATTEAGNLYNESAKLLKDPMAALVKKVDSKIPETSTFMKKISARTKTILGISDEETSEYKSDEQMQEENIKSTVDNTFNQQQEMNRESAHNVRFQVGYQQTGVTNRLLASLNQGVMGLNSFNSRVALNYQKKSLEIQLRSYLVHKASFNFNRTALTMMLEQNKALIYNSSLPDIQKIRQSKEVGNHRLAKYAFTKGRALLGNSTFIENVTKNIKDRVKEQVENLKYGLEETNSFGDIASEGPSSMTMAGMFAGGVISLDTAVKYIGSKLAKKFIKPGGKLDTINKKLFKYTADNEGGFNRGMQTLAQKIRPSDKEKYEVGGFKNSVKETLANLIEEVGTRRDSGYVDKRDGLGSLKSPAIFDISAQKSITTIIPGYLARILQRIEFIKPGNPNSDLLVFDHSRNAFTSIKHRTKSTRQNIEQSMGAPYARKQLSDLVDTTFQGSDMSEESRDALRKGIVRGSFNKQLIDGQYLLSDEFHRRLDSKTSKEIKNLVNTHIGTDVDKNNALIEASAKFKEDFGDPRGYIESMINAGREDDLSRLGLISRTPNGYKIQMKKVETFLTKGKELSRPIVNKPTPIDPLINYGKTKRDDFVATNPTIQKGLGAISDAGDSVSHWVNGKLTTDYAEKVKRRARTAYLVNKRKFGRTSRYLEQTPLSDIISDTHDLLQAKAHHISDTVSNELDSRLSPDVKRKITKVKRQGKVIALKGRRQYEAAKQYAQATPLSAMLGDGQAVAHNLYGQSKDYATTAMDGYNQQFRNNTYVQAAQAKVDKVVAQHTPKFIKAKTDHYETAGEVQQAVTDGLKKIAAINPNQQTILGANSNTPDELDTKQTTTKKTPRSPLSTIISLLKEHNKDFKAFSNSILDVHVISDNVYEQLSKEGKATRRGVKHRRGLLGRMMGKIGAARDRIMDPFHLFGEKASTVWSKLSTKPKNAFEALKMLFPTRALQKLISIPFTVIEGVFKGMGLAKEAYNKVKKYIKIPSFIKNGVVSVGKAILNHPIIKNCKQEDIYVLEADGKRLRKDPVMTRSGIIRGEYYTRTGKVVQGNCSIKGEIYDKDGNVVLSESDLRIGIFNKDGKPIIHRSLLNKILGFAPRVLWNTAMRFKKQIASAASMVGHGLLALPKAAWHTARIGSKVAMGAAKGVFAGIKGLGTVAGAIGGKAAHLLSPLAQMFGTSLGFYGSKSYSVLVEIRDILKAHLVKGNSKKTKVKGGATSEVTDPNAEIYAGSWWHRKKLAAKAGVSKLAGTAGIKGLLSKILKKEKGGGGSDGIMNDLKDAGELLGGGMLLDGLKKKLGIAAGDSLKKGLFKKLFKKGIKTGGEDLAKTGATDAAEAGGADAAGGALAGVGADAAGASTLGLALPAAGVALAGGAGYLAGKYVVNPLINKATKAVTGGKVTSLGQGIYNLTHSVPNPHVKLYAKRESSANAPTGIKQNNPGYIKSWGKFNVRNGIIYFPTPEVGLVALAIACRVYAGEGHSNLMLLLKKLSLPGYWKHSKSFITSVAIQAHLSPTETLDLTNATMLDRLITAIIIVENGKMYYSPEMIHSVAMTVARETKPTIPVSTIVTKIVKKDSKSKGLAKKPKKPKKNTSILSTVENDAKSAFSFIGSESKKAFSAVSSAANSAWSEVSGSAVGKSASYYASKLSKIAKADLTKSVQTTKSLVRSICQKYHFHTDLLMAIAAAESGFKDVKNPMATAAGLFQYIDSTWVSKVKQYGSQIGVSLKSTQYDDAAATKIAGISLNDDIAEISHWKHPVLNVDPYMVHFLGAGGAQKFFKLLTSVPTKPAVNYYPASYANENKLYFYDSKGNPYSIKGMYEFIAFHLGATAKSYGINLNGMDPIGGKATAKAVPASIKTKVNNVISIGKKTSKKPAVHTPAAGGASGAGITAKKPVIGKKAPAAGGASIIGKKKPIAVHPVHTPVTITHAQAKKAVRDALNSTAIPQASLSTTSVDAKKAMKDVLHNTAIPHASPEDLKALHDSQTYSGPKARIMPHGFSSPQPVNTRNGVPVVVKTTNHDDVKNIHGHVVDIRDTLHQSLEYQKKTYELLKEQKDKADGKSTSSPKVNATPAGRMPPMHAPTSVPNTAVGIKRQNW
jgi:hypothetical protein